MRKKTAVAVLGILLFASPVLAQTDVQAQIAALLLQIKALQQQLALLQGTAGAQCVDLTFSLGSDDTDADTNGEVSKLQNFLVASNLMDSTLPHGFFGPITMHAVQQWQSQKGIVSSGTPDSTGYGFVGPRTRAAMACSATTPPPPSQSCTFNGQTIVNGQSVTAYQAFAVPNGQACVSQTRACTNGALSGNYLYASCTVLPPDTGGSTVVPEGYSLVEVHRSSGNCSDLGYAGTNPDLPCNNWNTWYPRNQTITTYRLKVPAKAGDKFRVEGQVTTTNDGNAGYIVEQQGITCANIRGIPIERDPVTGMIDGFWANKMLAECPTNIWPDWMLHDPVVTPDGAQLSTEQSTAVAQVVVSGPGGQQLIGGRAQQEHGADWSNDRKCVAYPGENCRGHMSENIAGLYTAPSDGTYTFEVQVADISGAAVLKRFSAEAGGGQIIVEQFRKAADTTSGYGIAEVSNTQSQLISQYGQASCPDHDDRGINNSPDPYTVFKLSTAANTGDIVRVFARAMGGSITPNDTDASALGIYRSPTPYPTAPLDFVAHAWGLYGHSFYLPLAMMYTEGHDPVDTTGTRLYRATLHASDAPVNCDNTSIIAPPDPVTGNAFGGKVQSAAGSMSLIRYSPRSASNNLMLLQSAKEYGTPKIATIATNSPWQTVFQDSFDLAKAGAARIWFQLNMQQVNQGNVGTQITCKARIYVTDVGLAGGDTLNTAYKATDNMYLIADFIQTLPAGTHQFQAQVYCSAADGIGRTFYPLNQGAYASLETFSN